ncbi:transcriptional repressor [Candidatus Peregrinibacteria bacterium]|nr:transcriptional repressor [Candidatus Peregrinibacteria bacterium]
MKNFIQMAENILREDGLRLTKPRSMALNFLAKENQPLTPYEIRDLLKEEGEKADVVTIYRILEEFERLGLVHKVTLLGRYIRCSDLEMETHCEKDIGCHHYLICEKCSKVQEISGENLHDLERVIEKKTGFEVKNHFLEFLGLCKKCKK